MLTRLRVSGFKNLVNADIAFGPFTCIAGANGSGKSNLFDAITFLSALADRPLLDAALSVRDKGGRAADVRGIFHQVGQTHDHTLSFEADMIIPSEGVDDLGQPAEASSTFLRYTLELAYRRESSQSPLALNREDLTHIALSDARKNLLFSHSANWRTSAVRGKRSSSFISTTISPTDVGNDRIIRLHQDGVQGRVRSFAAATLPRTVLSSANATESPTALLARREMQSWRLLQLEPSALRQPDEFAAPSRMGGDGSHLAATLYRLAHSRHGRDQEGDDAYTQQVYAQVSNRLAELIDNVGRVWVERDERRELLTLMMSDRAGTAYPARALSDGTLRFLALVILDLDTEVQGLLCLEEPENGIHPARIPAMLTLLESIAMDAQIPIGVDNPLRQVIINTHLPSVVGQVPDDSLIVAELKEQVNEVHRFQAARFSGLPDTWRGKIASQVPAVALGTLLTYLNPLNPEAIVSAQQSAASVKDGTADRHSQRVIDRPDLRVMLPGFGEAE